MTPRGSKSGISGFTLVEALVATALMGLVLAVLATITRQWLPNWDRSLARVQRTELLDIGLQRVITDLAASEFIPANGQTSRPLFEGTTTSVVFVRAAIGPNTRHGLDVVRIAEGTDERGAILVRSRTPFVPTAAPLSQAFTDPVVLVRTPFRVSFSFVGSDRVWREAWHDEGTLPAAIRINVRDAETGRLLPPSTVVTLHIDAPAQCASTDDCAGASSKTDDTKSNDTKAGNGASAGRP